MTFEILRATRDHLLHLPTCMYLCIFLGRFALLSPLYFSLVFFQHFTNKWGNVVYLKYYMYDCNAEVTLQCDASKKRTGCNPYSEWPTSSFCIKNTLTDGGKICSSRESMSCNPCLPVRGSANTYLQKRKR